MSSTTVIRAIAKWWWVVLTLTVTGGIVGGLVGVFAAPTYTSSAQMIVAYDAPAGAGSAELVQANNFAIQKVYAYQEVALSPRVLGDVIDTLGLDMTTEELASEIAVSVPLNTPVMQISASAENPEDALTLTETVVESFSNVVIELETPTAGGVPSVRIEMLEEPTLPTTPSSASVLVTTAVGLAVGLALGVIWIAIAAASDRRIHSADSVNTSRTTARRRVIGSVPASPDTSVTVLVDQPLSRAAESYRTIAATLGHTPGARLGTIAVVPATPRDTTSALTANLALAMHEFGARVVLVDANLRSGTISSSLGVTGGPGLAECIRGEATVAQALSASIGGMPVLPAGATLDSPAELMSGSALEGILKELRGSYEMIFLDVAPALPLSDAIFAVTAADSTIVAVSAGRVTGSELEAAASSLAAVDAEVLGIVVMDAPVAGVDADASTSLYRDLRPVAAG
ncbi:AAA family ATPase [Microbacterium sp. NPDC019599]|uniref:AAA family ATPase n=1 Tax=Microbacterium sp. NPDC019599 TaxID=3154690 RepID=UPI0033F3FFEB